MLKYESFVTRNPNTKTLSVVRVNHAKEVVTLKVLSDNWYKTMKNSIRIDRQKRKRILARLEEMGYTIERG